MNFEIKIMAVSGGDFVQLSVQDDRDRMVEVAILDVDYKKAIKKAETIFEAMTELNNALVD